MNIGHRLRVLREERNLSQGDIERRTGMLRCYVSRVEGGYILPNLKTLEKWAKALDLELYQLFFAGEGRPEPPPSAPKKPKPRPGSDGAALLKVFDRMS
ncbi:MAG TPA: helix-turn-helix transcriptional regulator, partial [Acidobacteriota bacterium]|nr:helix-turn-helix transcriptional regulator [Acidobacteriota bacterium]